MCVCEGDREKKRDGHIDVSVEDKDSFDHIWSVTNALLLSVRTSEVPSQLWMRASDEQQMLLFTVCFNGDKQYFTAWFCYFHSILAS